MNIDPAILAYNELIAAFGLDAPKWLPDDDADFKVVHLDGCVLLFGLIPLSSLSKALKKAPKNAVMSPYLGQLSGCTIATGLRADLDALGDRLKPLALARTREQVKDSGLSENAITWLAIGERGMSSNAMFFHLTGILPPGMSAGDETQYPLDADDLSRSRKLLEQVPELRTKLLLMSTVSPVWSRLIHIWDQLVSTMDRESPDWRNRVGSAPLTCAMMEKAIEG